MQHSVSAQDCHHASGTRPPSAPGTGGFTIVELIVTVGLLGVVLLGLVAALVESHRTNQNFSERRAARAEAERFFSKMEATSRERYGENIIDKFHQTTFSVEGLEPPENGGPMGFIIVDQSNRLNAGDLKVNIRINWNGVMGEQELIATRHFYVH